MAIGQIELEGLDLGLVGGHLSFGLLDQEALIVHLLTRHGILLEKNLVTTQVGLRLREHGLVMREGALRLQQRNLVRPWVDLGEEIAFAH